MQGNFVEISFQAQFLRKARNFVEIRLHYFCTILYFRVDVVIQHYINFSTAGSTAVALIRDAQLRIHVLSMA